MFNLARIRWWALIYLWKLDLLVELLKKNANLFICDDLVATFCLIGVSFCDKLEYSTLVDQRA